MTDDALTLGSLIDARECRITLTQGELVSDIIVIARTTKADGGHGIRVTETPGTDWITRRGILEAALDLERRVGQIDSTGCHPDHSPGDTP